MKNKKTKIVSIVAIVALALTLVTATFAYFQAQTGEGSQTDIKINANTVDTFTFETGDAISLNINQDNFASGKGNQKGTTFAKAMLTANNKTNTATEHYNLFLNISDNSFGYTQSTNNPEILLTIKDSSNNEITSITGLEYKTVTDGSGATLKGFDITNKTGLITILNNREITTTSSKMDQWNITATFINYNADQSKNAGKVFSAQVLISKDSFENYTPNTINTLSATKNGSSLTVNLNVEQGSNEIDKYYYGIKEKSTLAYNNNTSKVKRLANTNSISSINYIESTSNSYTFTNIDNTKNYEISAYVVDKKKIKSNTYEYNYYSDAYVYPVINKVETTSTSNSITATITATKGTNNITKYYYSIDGGNTFVEYNSNIYTFSNVDDGVYRIMVKVMDSNNKYSNIYVKNGVIKETLTLSLSNYTFEWNQITGATKYQVYSDNKLLTTTSNTKIEIYDRYYNPGTYNISIVALNDKNNILMKSNLVNYTLTKTEFPLTTGISEFNTPEYPTEWLDSGVVYSNAWYISNPGTTSLEYFLSEEIDGSKYYINYFNLMTYMKENNIKYEQASGVNMNNNALAISEHINYDVNFCENNNTCTYRKLANLNTTIVEPVASFKYISSSKKIELRGNGGNTYLAIQFVEVGKTPSDWKIFGGYLMCLSENTEVYVYDEKKKKYRKKKIGDLTYDDEVLCWNFDKGEFTKAKPIWLMKKMKTTKYNLLKFSDGSALETIDQHRIFNVEKGMFTYPMTDDTPIGTTTFNSKGEYVKLISKEVIEKPIDYYNANIGYHINMFANGILTSCRLNNMYPIKDMKFIYNNQRNNGFDLSDYDEKLVNGLRLKEQNMTEEEIRKYVDDREIIRKIC